MPIITPQTFEGMRRADYIKPRLTHAGIAHRVYLQPKDMLRTSNDDMRALGMEIGNILKEEQAAVLLGEIRTSSGMHAIAFGFRLDETRQLNAVFMDPTGNRLPTALAPHIPVIIEAAGFKGQTTLQTGITAQQTEAQPNTCGLWLIKNTCDFLLNGMLAEPQTTQEADLMITDELKRYLHFEETTTYKPPEQTAIPQPP